MKKKQPTIDGLSPKNIKDVRSAIRQVWQRSTPRRLCIKRATHDDGYPRCEKCKKMVPKIFVDHINPVGELQEGFLERLFCPSTGLMALCKECHALKTKQERKAKKQALRTY